MKMHVIIIKQTAIAQRLVEKDAFSTRGFSFRDANANANVQRLVREGHQGRDELRISWCKLRENWYDLLGFVVKQILGAS